MMRRILISVLLLMAAGVGARAADEAPPWLQQLAKAPAPTYEKDVSAVVLLNEQRASVSDDGRITTVTTYAVRILLREGRTFAQAVEFYQNDAGRIKDLKAWVISPNGAVKKYGKDETIDRVEDPSDVYNESRLKLINAAGDVDTGAIFGYQSTTEERSIFAQRTWQFQDRLPTLTSRVVLSLPQEWTAKSITFNHDPITAAVGGSTYTWELQNLPPISPEPSSPRLSSLAPRIAVSFYSNPEKPSPNFKSISKWSEVSFWLTELHDPQSSPNEVIAAKVKELTANAHSEIEKLRAVATFVQNVRYIAIAIGLSRGGGMRPRSAAEVFAKSYGDCKDKANLMRAMLKVLNITSYPVGIYSGDPNFVHEEWPSPTQFNHCIIAIKVADETQAPTIITHPTLGRLLIFDATDDNTPIGDLPQPEQGSWALVCAGEDGGLVRVPVTPVESNVLERKIDAHLSADGSLAATIQENANGQWASAYRGEFRSLARPDYQKVIERWIAAGATAAKINKVEPRDDRNSGRFNLDIDFVAPSYGQLMQRLMIFKPTIVSRRDALALTDPKRKQPVVLTSIAYSETLHLQLPDGFGVDELPDPVKLDASFGSYTTNYEVTGSELLFTRKLVQKAGTIPVEQYNTVRTFFEKIRAAEQSPVVLARK
jgi:transglutaminase-like putative cysteine protease